MVKDFEELKNNQDWLGAEFKNLIKEISELRDGDISNDSIDWNIILNHSLNSELEKTLSCADISVLNTLINELYFFRNRDWVKKLFDSLDRVRCNVLWKEVCNLIKQQSKVWLKCLMWSKNKKSDLVQLLKNDFPEGSEYQINRVVANLLPFIKSFKLDENTTENDLNVYAGIIWKAFQDMREHDFKFNVSKDKFGLSKDKVKIWKDFILNAIPFLSYSYYDIKIWKLVMFDGEKRKPFIINEQNITVDGGITTVWWDKKVKPKITEESPATELTEEPEEPTLSPELEPEPTPNLDLEPSVDEL